MSTIKAVLFNIFSLNSLSEILFVDDPVLPNDIKRFIISFQMKSFVNVKNVDRNILFNQLWLHAANIYLKDESHRFSVISEVEFRLARAKKQLHFNRFANRIYGVPIKVDIYTNEDFLNCDAYDRLYGKGNLENIVNITRNGVRPNIKNFKKLTIICEDNKIIKNGKEMTLYLTDSRCFPLKKEQKVVVISDDFHDKKFRVVATAFIAKEQSINEQMAIIRMDKSYDINTPENAFMVLHVSQLAIYK